MSRKQNSLMRFSRTERLAQLSEQEIVIERKKREIQAKIEAQKKKDTEEALKKIEASKEIKTNKPGFSKKLSSWKSYEQQKDKRTQNSVDEDKKESLKNAFSNDGSFLDQFKKLSKSGSGPYVDINKLTTSVRDDLQNYDDSEGTEMNATYDYGRENISFKESTKSNEPNQIPENLRSTFTAIQSVSQNPMPLIHPRSEVQSVPGDGISHECTKGMEDNYPINHTSASGSVQPPSLTQVHNTPHPVPTKTEPKPHLDSISMSFKSNVAKKLEVVNPFEEDDDDDDETTTERHVGGGNLKEKQQNLPSLYPTATAQGRESSRFSPALTKETEKESGRGIRRENEEDKHNRLAEIVAKCGDDFEEVLRKRNDNDPSLGFLYDKTSSEYLSFRQRVADHRRKLKDRDNSSGSNSSDEDASSSRQRERRRRLGGEKDGRCENEERPHPQDGYQADGEDELSYYKMPEGGAQVPASFPTGQNEPLPLGSGATGQIPDGTDTSKSDERRKRKRKSRWGDAVASSSNIQPPALVTNLNLQTTAKLPAPKTNLLSQLTRSDPGLIQYARQTFGSTNLSEEDWKKAEDHYKINLLYQDLVKKRAEIDKLERAGKFKYEYDSDEDVEGGTWEHKLRQQEMMATQLWAEELTRQAAGKHHIGDFLPPEELERFMEKYNAVKEGREPDLSDYKEFKLKEDNVGYRLLQKMGWNEGQGLGQDGSGITNPVNKATTRHENQGLGIERPDGLEAGDDEYDAYRKRMMLAYRFRPNPLNNPRRPYY